MSSELFSQIQKLIQEYEKNLKTQLIHKGISEDLLNDIFEDSADVCDSESQDESAPLPTKRFLAPSSFTNLINPKPRFNTDIGTNEMPYQAAPSMYPQREKFPQDFSDGKVVLVLNYVSSPDKPSYSHALFADFGKTYIKFKDSFLKNSDLMAYNMGLIFGQGWIVKNKNRVGEVRKALTSAGIKYREVEFAEYLEEVKNPKQDPPPKDLSKDVKPPKETPKEVSTKKVESKQVIEIEAKEVSSSSDEESEIPVVETKKVIKNKPKVEPKDVPKVESKPPPAKEIKSKVQSSTPKADNKKSVKKNSHGNYEEADTGTIIMKLPIGKDGILTRVALGYQDPLRHTEKGLLSVSKFDSELEKAAKSLGHTVLSADIIQVVKKKDEVLATKLLELWNREEVNDESGSVVEESETHTGSEDS